MYSLYETPLTPAPTSAESHPGLIHTLVTISPHWSEQGFLLSPLDRTGLALGKPRSWSRISEPFAFFDKKSTLVRHTHSPHPSTRHTVSKQRWGEHHSGRFLPSQTSQPCPPSPPCLPRRLSSSALGSAELPASYLLAKAVGFLCKRHTREDSFSCIQLQEPGASWKPPPPSLHKEP